MYDVIRSITDRVKLIKVNNKVLILKTYNLYQNKTDVTEYINLLNNYSIPTIQYHDFEWLEDNQLCLECIQQFYTADKNTLRKCV